MSIKSTVRISCDFAISRIREIHDLALGKDYLGFESASSLFDISGIEKWTNHMLADKMDTAFYRISRFDNYVVE